MPIDYSLLSGIKPVQFSDPLGQYNNFLQAQNAQQQNALGQRQVAAAEMEMNQNALLNEGYRVSKTPDEMRAYMAEKGLGTKIGAYNKQQADLEESKFKNQKTQAEIGKFEAENIASALKRGQDRFGKVVYPQQAEVAIRQGHADPAMKSYLTSIGSTEEADLTELRQAVKSGTYPQWLEREQMGYKEHLDAALDQRKQKYTEVNDAADRTSREKTNDATNATSALNNAATNATSRFNNDNDNRTRLAAQNLAPTDVTKALAPEVVRDISGLKGLAEGVSGRSADRQKILDIIKGGKVLVGPAADWKKKYLTGLVATNTASPEDIETLNNTDKLDKYLANNVWQKISGLRSSGVNLPRVTNLDLQLAGKSTAGDKNMSKQAIVDIVSAEDATDKDVIKHYMSRVKGVSPEVRKYHGFTPVIPQAHADFLKAHPTTAADFDLKYYPGASAEILGGQ